MFNYIRTKLINSYFYLHTAVRIVRLGHYLFSIFSRSVNKVFEIFEPKVCTCRDSRIVCAVLLQQFVFTESFILLRVGEVQITLNP